MNEENQILREFLINSKEGKNIFRSCQNSKELEKKVREYHNKRGIPNWDFEDDYNEGIDWVTFDDLFISILDDTFCQNCGKSGNAHYSHTKSTHCNSFTPFKEDNKCIKEKTKQNPLDSNFDADMEAQDFEEFGQDKI